MSLYESYIKRSFTEKFTITNINKANVMLFVKRDDLIHPEVSGNKFRKLKYNIAKAKTQNCQSIITYGGAYSNHLLAVAAAGLLEGIKTIGIVRGNELNASSNKLLKRCAELGMELSFIDRYQYKQKKYSDGIEQTKTQLLLHIPEGGANIEGVLGCRDIITETSNDYDYIFVAQGTCTTSVGIYMAMSSRSKLVVVPVLKGFDSLGEMKKLAKQVDLEIDFNRVEVLNEYHFGGYAKSNRGLDVFVDSFNRHYSFNIEPIYTGKVMFAMQAYLAKIKGNKKALFVHTGGLFNL
jgi:1-aminocyclopropane-1-carboxylate deaminase